MTTYTLRGVADTLDAADAITNRAVSHVNLLQGVIDSVETSTEYRLDGKINVVVFVDYEPVLS